MKERTDCMGYDGKLPIICINILGLDPLKVSDQPLSSSECLTFS